MALTMRRQHTGRGGSPVIGDDWSAGHRPAAAQTHTGACSIRHSGGTKGAFNPTTGEYPITPNAAHFTGPCSVTRLPASEQTPTVADEIVPTVEYTVGLDWAAAAATIVGDLVTITTAGPNGDPTLTGRTLTVESIDRGTLAWERILRCTENQS